jgi:hypothetical protein
MDTHCQAQDSQERESVESESAGAKQLADDFN